MIYVLRDKKTKEFDMDNEYSLEQLIDIARQYDSDIYSEHKALVILSKNGYEVFTIE